MCLAEEIRAIRVGRLGGRTVVAVRSVRLVGEFTGHQLLLEKMQVLFRRSLRLKALRFGQCVFDTVVEINVVAEVANAELMA